MDSSFNSNWILFSQTMASPITWTNDFSKSGNARSTLHFYLPVKWTIPVCKFISSHKLRKITKVIQNLPKISHYMYDWIYVEYTAHIHRTGYAKDLTFEWHTPFGICQMLRYIKSSIILHCIQEALFTPGNDSKIESHHTIQHFEFALTRDCCILHYMEWDATGGGEGAGRGSLRGGAWSR